MADAVVQFAREQLAGGEGRRTSALARRRHVQPAPAARHPGRARSAPPGRTRDRAVLRRSRDEPFFVKNLENIQGDERDVIFLSVTYAKGRDGRLRYNFGPLNGENGWRRLNVLTTRARRAMRVFSSMRASDIHEGQSPGGPAAPGIPRLRRARPARSTGGRRGGRPSRRSSARSSTSSTRRGHVVSRRSASPATASTSACSTPTRRGASWRHRVRRRGVPRVGDGARPRPAAAAGARGARLDDPAPLVHRLVQGPRGPDRAAGTCHCGRTSQGGRRAFGS